MKSGDKVKSNNEHAQRFRNCDSCMPFTGVLDHIRGNIAFVKIEGTRRFRSINTFWLERL